MFKSVSIELATAPLIQVPSVSVSFLSKTTAKVMWTSPAADEPYLNEVTSYRVLVQEMISADLSKLIEEV